MKKHHLLLAALLMPLSVQADQSGITIEETELKNDAMFYSGTIAKLPEKTRLTIGVRINGWVAVQTGTGKDSKAGWVRLAAVRLEPQAKGLFSGLFGPRGLSGDNLRKAQPAPQELQKLQRYVLSRAEVEKFASSVKLEKRNVDYPSPDDAAADARNNGGAE
ncbi:MAG: hypothetical protein AB1513_03645 [Pseudomonadota bacterium]